MKDLDVARQAAWAGVEVIREYGDKSPDVRYKGVNDRAANRRR